MGKGLHKKEKKQETRTSTEKSKGGRYDENK